MKLQMVALRDTVANVYNQPNFVPHLGMAIRSFGDECQRQEKGNVMAAHPEDFELWHIGEYDDQDLSQCRFFPESDRKQLAVGANYRHRAEPTDREKLRAAQNHSNYPV